MPAASSLPYPTMGFGGYGGGSGGMPMPMPDSGFNAPQMPPMPMPMPGGFEPSADDPATVKEMPFQSVAVPIAEGMFSSVSNCYAYFCMYFIQNCGLVHMQHLVNITLKTIFVFE